MRKVILMALLSLLSVQLHASEKEIKSNLFKCVDNESLAVNQACMEQSMELDLGIQQQLFNESNLGGELGDYAMATITFYPEKHLIEVVAHSESAETSLASNSNY